MNPSLTDHRLAGPGWRRRYHAAFTTLLHFKLTVQALGLPDDPAPEQLSAADLDRFLHRLLADLERFALREARFLHGLRGEIRPWRMAELLPLLDLFDETTSLSPTPLSAEVRAEWRRVAAAFLRLKGRVVQLHLFG